MLTILQVTLHHVVGIRNKYFKETDSIHHYTAIL